VAVKSIQYAAVYARRSCRIESSKIVLMLSFSILFSIFCDLGLNQWSSNFQTYFHQQVHDIMPSLLAFCRYIHTRRDEGLYTEKVNFICLVHVRAEV
jgi:hypothetical protein